MKLSDAFGLNPNHTQGASFDFHGEK